MSETILFIPDIHIPDNHKPALTNLLAFIQAFQPDRIIQTGDLMDLKGPARWSKGTAVEYQDNLQANANATKEVLARIRMVYDGPFAFKRGNHDVRIQRYLSTYAPALRSLDALTFERLLNFEYYEIDQLDPVAPVKIARDWYVTHGDEGSLSQKAGETAFKLAKRYDVNLVCGHTHRLGVLTETFGLRPRSVTGVEVGHMMDQRKADYLKLPPNWQMGFAMLHVLDNGIGVPQLVPMDRNGGFTVEGVSYK